MLLAFATAGWADDWADLEPATPGRRLVKVPQQLTAAIEDMAAAGIEERGAVFTRPEVVNLILDLAGHTAAQPLHCRRVLAGAKKSGEKPSP
jgi:hypothetical protein